MILRPEVSERSSSIIEAARSFIGTRFSINTSAEHQTDCGGLLIKVAKKVGLHYAEVPRRYSVLDCGGLPLYLHLRSCMDEVPLEEAGPGDAVLFWIRSKDYPCHLGILCGTTMVHAQSVRVQEVPITNAWDQRTFAAFRYRSPGAPEGHVRGLHAAVHCERCVLGNTLHYARRGSVASAPPCPHEVPWPR